MSGRSLGSIRNSPHGGRARSALRIFQENISNQETKGGSPTVIATKSSEIFVCEEFFTQREGSLAVVS